MRLAARIALVIALSAGIAAGAAGQGADPVKSGQWEFNTELRSVGAPQVPPGARPDPGGGMKVSHTQCIEPDKAVPSDPRRECKVERMERKGAVISWSTTCKAPQGVVETAGTARYSGDTMEANLNMRAPNGKGGFIESRQHVTGRYLGPCTGK